MPLRNLLYALLSFFFLTLSSACAPSSVHSEALNVAHVKSGPFLDPPEQIGPISSGSALLKN